MSLKVPNVGKWCLDHHLDKRGRTNGVMHEAKARVLCMPQTSFRPIGFVRCIYLASIGAALIPRVMVYARAVYRRLRVAAIARSVGQYLIGSSD